jgi:hypothetical protein
MTRVMCRALREARMYSIVLRLLLLCVAWMGGWAPVMRAQDASVAAQPGENSASPSVRSLADAEHLYRTGKLDAAVQEYSALLAAGSQPALAYAGLERVDLKQKRPAEAYIRSGQGRRTHTHLGGGTRGSG